MTNPSVPNQAPVAVPNGTHQTETTGAAGSSGSPGAPVTGVTQQTDGITGKSVLDTNKKDEGK